MRVFVINKRNQPLMPCKPQAARRLLNDGKAKVIMLAPFTIQLTITTGESVQPGVLGVDPGYSHVGVSVIAAAEEVLSVELLLRSDIVNLNSERKQYRKSRRGRKTWYRKPRFLNRDKEKGWFPPSIQHKRESMLKIIWLVKKLVPIDTIIVETASFDIQKIKNPEIQGVEYQDGAQKNFWNVREYVLYRDYHRCQQCKGKSKDKALQVHHIESRKTSGNRPDNLITLCKTCHSGVHENRLKLKQTKTNGFRAETFMTVVRNKLLEELEDTCDNVVHTYGYITKSRRVELGLTKSHRNDAFVIAGGASEKRSDAPYLVKQVRKQNRKLFKGIRSHIKNTAPRFVKGFQRFDKVQFKHNTCFIFGRRSSGYFDLRRLNGQIVHRSAKANNLKLIQPFDTFLWESNISFPPSNKFGGFHEKQTYIKEGARSL